MSKKERIASSLDRITDLCFTISELAIGDDSEGEEQQGLPRAVSVLRLQSSDLHARGRRRFLAKRSLVPEEDEECFDREWEWDSIPDLPSESDFPPSYSQVAGIALSLFGYSSLSGYP